MINALIKKFINSPHSFVSMVVWASTRIYDWTLLATLPKLNFSVTRERSVESMAQSIMIKKFPQLAALIRFTHITTYTYVYAAIHNLLNNNVTLLILRIP